MKYLRKIFIIFLVLSPLALIYLIPRSVKIESLRCVNQYGKCNEDLLIKLENVNGSNLYDARKKINSLLKNDSTITKRDKKTFNELISLSIPYCEALIDEREGDEKWNDCVFVLKNKIKEHSHAQE